MISAKKIENFVRAFYKKKDQMHDLSHVRRILKAAIFLARNYTIDEEVLECGAYFHGVSNLSEHEEQIRKFLQSQEASKEKIDRIVRASYESKSEASASYTKAETTEGKILHDANLIEGGKTFLVVKALITGALKGQSLQQTIDYLERNVLGRFKCYLPEAQEVYEEKQVFTRKFLQDLKANL